MSCFQAFHARFFTVLVGTEGNSHFEISCEICLREVLFATFHRFKRQDFKQWSVIPASEPKQDHAWIKILTPGLEAYTFVPTLGPESHT